MSDGSRSKLLDEIFGLQSTCGLDSFATSRFILSITNRFQSSLSLEIRAQEEDVRKYISSNIHRLPTCVQRRPDLQEKVVGWVAQVVDGM